MPSLVQILEAVLQASETPLSTGELLDILNKASALHEEEQETPLPLPSPLSEELILQSLEQLEQQLASQNRALTLRKRYAQKICLKRRHAHLLLC